MRFIICTDCSFESLGEANMGRLGVREGWLSNNSRAGGLCLSHAEQL